MDKNLLEEGMASLQKGDINALDIIYSLMSKTVYYLSYSILKNAQAAQDIAQDTFIRVYKNIDKYKLNSNAVAWILTMARNLSINEYQKHKNDLRLYLFEDTLSDKTNYSNNIENTIFIKKAMDILSDEEREVVMLYTFDCFKHREIAQILDKPMGTVQWIYNKAIKKLRNDVDKPNSLDGGKL